MTGQVALMLGVVACAAGRVRSQRERTRRFAGSSIRNVAKPGRRGLATPASATSNGSSARLTPRISPRPASESGRGAWMHAPMLETIGNVPSAHGRAFSRSEEHTSELQSHSDLVCRLLLEKKK